jgi:hypothetical protein
MRLFVEMTWFEGLGLWVEMMWFGFIVSGTGLDRVLLQERSFGRNFERNF